METVARQRTPRVRQILAQLFAQAVTVAPAIFDPGADEHEILAVKPGADVALLRRGIRRACGVENDLIRRVFRFLGELQRQRARTRRLGVDLTWKSGGAGPKERDAVASPQIAGDPVEGECVQFLCHSVYP